MKWKYVHTFVRVFRILAPLECILAELHQLGEGIQVCRGEDLNSVLGVDIDHITVDILKQTEKSRHTNIGNRDLGLPRLPHTGAEHGAKVFRPDRDDGPVGVDRTAFDNKGDVGKFLIVNQLL